MISDTLGEAKSRDWLSRKDMWRNLIFSGVNPCDTHGRSTSFFKMLRHKNCSLDWKSQRDDKRKESQSLKFCRQKSSWLKPFSCKYMLPVLKRKDYVVVGPESPESEAISHRVPEIWEWLLVIKFVCKH